MDSKFKAVSAAFVQNISDFFEINVEIRLFGVRVFTFTWPPKEEKSNLISHE